MKTLPALLPLLLTALPTLAIAQSDGPAALASSQTKNSASITLSPVHLVIGVVEVTGEYRVAPKLGVGATLGGGKIDDITVAEAGAQIAYYVTGDFDGGLHLGAEVQYLTAVNNPDEDMGSSANAEGLAVGPMIGWKWISAVGFSFVAQAGVQYMAVQAEASNGAAMASAEDSRIAPLINLNAGWSF